MLFCKFNCKEYYNSNRENYGSLLKKLILRGTAQILTEVVTKFNRLVKYLMIFGGGHFHLQRRSQLTVSQKCIYEGIYKASASKNQAQPANPQQPTTISSI